MKHTGPPDTIMECSCGCAGCARGEHCFRQPCWESQRRAFHLVRANGTVLAEVEYRGDLIMWVHAKGVRMQPPGPHS